jgi:hypothetical protein
MPAETDTFAMLRPNVLASLTVAQLHFELDRALKMQGRVNEYITAVLAVLQNQEQRST